LNNIQLAQLIALIMVYLASLAWCRLDLEKQALYERWAISLHEYMPCLYNSMASFGVSCEVAAAALHIPITTVDPSLHVFNDKIYRFDETDGGRLYEWNGVNAWVER